MCLNSDGSIFNLVTTGLALIEWSGEFRRLKLTKLQNILGATRPGELDWGLLTRNCNLYTSVAELKCKRN